MRSNKGVTLIYLVVTIIIMLIMATITVTGSLTAYKTMKYETLKAELQEVEEAVLEISEDYAVYKKNNSSASYSDYFTSKFSSVPTLATDSTSTDVTTRMSDYADKLATDYTYYFSSDDLGTYMGLEVSAIKAVLVDFSTDTICSVEGIVDPDDSSTYYYLLSEINGGTVYVNTPESSSSEVTVSPVTNTERTTVGNTTFLTVTLTLKQDGDGTDYPIKKAYYSTDGSTYIEVDYLGDCSYSDTTVSFVICDAGTYYFKIEDTSGETVTSDAVVYK